MRALIPGGNPPTLPEKQRTALISLLADDDPVVHQTVRRKLLSYGRMACDWLRPHLLSSDPLIRRRALEIVHHLTREDCDEQFIAFCLNSGEELDLERAVGLLARTQYPDTNLEAYQALYDCWANELRARIDFCADAEHILATINDYLFNELRFHGNEQYADSPENCYLNRVVDNRTGNPISVCAIYLFIARRLKLPMTGIGLPYHFVCRYQSSVKEIYIDVFRRGQFWTKGDCIKHLLNTNHSLHEGYLAPVSTRRMLLRMCANLHQTYSHLDMAEEANRVQRYLVALAK
ncbi:MAG: transglutaminase-like domain-containing protein [Verrucomicrobia subdivision 3 bacterium]|nr:transglutaminase-like domain-containing protein [Limisphaerales bacterium]